MSLTTCPECGHEVSTNAAACPNCGYALHDDVAASNPDAAPRRTPADRPLGTKQTHKRRRVGFGTKILLAIVLVFIALALAWYFGIVRFI